MNRYYSATKRRHLPEQKIRRAVLSIGSWRRGNHSPPSPPAGRQPVRCCFTTVSQTHQRPSDDEMVSPKDVCTPRDQPNGWFQGEQFAQGDIHLEASKCGSEAGVSTESERESALAAGSCVSGAQKGRVSIRRL